MSNFDLDAPGFQSTYYQLTMSDSHEQRKVPITLAGSQDANQGNKYNNRGVRSVARDAFESYGVSVQRKPDASFATRLEKSVKHAVAAGQELAEVALFPDTAAVSEAAVERSFSRMKFVSHSYPEQDC